MSKKFNIIINVSIIILIIALVTVMMRYYTGALDVPTNINSAKIDIELNHSGDNIITNVNNKETQTEDKIIVINNNQNSGDIKTNNEENNKKNDDIQNNHIESGDTDISENHENVPVSPVIITSESEISSKEKGEILTELDKTLMELLEVVDKVQTVDETRLITDDSEVQE